MGEVVKIRDRNINNDKYNFLNSLLSHIAQYTIRYKKDCIQGSFINITSDGHIIKEMKKKERVGEEDTSFRRIPPVVLHQNLSRMERVLALKAFNHSSSLSLV